jgi:malate dehydrogenase (oxaloacetate-decarboxylating)
MTTPEFSQANDIRKRYNGLISVRSKVQVRDSKALSLVYTPGVAEPCLEIARNPERSFDVTCRGNTIAIVSNGTAAFGLGNVGPEAILPVLEAKAVIMKNFAGIDALPLALNVNNAEDFVSTILNISPTFGGIDLEDIAGATGLAITNRLERALNIPILNSHREGVAIGVLAGLINAMRLVEKDLKQARIVINGAGAAGLGTAYLLHKYGAQNVIVCDRSGAIYKYRPHDMHWAKWEIAKISNPSLEKGDLPSMLKGADAFINFVSGIATTAEMIRSMTSKHPILFAFGSPISITPYRAREAGATVVATAHSSYPNQMDITAVVPGVFRGLLDVRATGFCVPAQLAAAEAIAGIITQEELNPDYIYPRILDYRVAPAVAEAVAQVTAKRGYAKKPCAVGEVLERTRRFVYEGHFPVPPISNKSKTLAEMSLEMHDRFQGVLEIQTNIPVKDEFIMKQFYLVPGALDPVKLIQEDVARSFDLTSRGNLVGVVSDGTAVLGLGNIGGRAAMPVMEGKAILFHTFAGVEAFPICLATSNEDEIVEIVQRLEPTFGGINLEDISAPRCFSIERRLQETTNIPIFHDDQHGTAVVVLAGILNACKILGKHISELSLVVNGAGASAVAVTKLLMASGLEDVVMLDTTGTLYKGRTKRMNWIKDEMAAMTNGDKVKGQLVDAVKGHDVFVGLSAPDVLTPEMIKTMAKNPIIFALANPKPEIMPDLALQAGAGIVATGRSDMPNQVNNSLAFPGIFRGALDTRVPNITDDMKIAAALAIANLVPEKDLRPEWIIPKGTDFSVAPAVAEAVARTAIESGQARVQVDPAAIAEKVRRHVYEKRG